MTFTFVGAVLVLYSNVFLVEVGRALWAAYRPEPPRRAVRGLLTPTGAPA